MNDRITEIIRAYITYFIYMFPHVDPLLELYVANKQVYT